MTGKPTGDQQDFFFIQMADVQFGIFAALSGADEARIEEYRRNRLIVRPAPKMTGFAPEVIDQIKSQFTVKPKSGDLR